MVLTRRQQWTLYYFCLFSVLFGIAMAVPVGPLESPPDNTIEQPDLFEGDMVGVKLNVPEQRNGVLNGANRWLDNKIPYQISNSFSSAQRNIIQAALREINTTCAALRMVPRTTGTRYFVSVEKGGPGTGCWSTVGRQGGSYGQVINLEVPSGSSTKNCVSRGTVLHELLHAAGFYHEQSKSDRDNYVEINWPNIAYDDYANFMPHGGASTTSFGEFYDFASIMHYGKYDFAISKHEWTIRPKNPWHNLLIGQRTGLSPADVRKLNAMYPPRYSADQGGNAPV